MIAIISRVYPGEGTEALTVVPLNEVVPNEFPVHESYQVNRYRYPSLNPVIVIPVCNGTKAVDDVDFMDSADNKKEGNV
jgi:hypothetical protein